MTTYPKCAQCGADKDGMRLSGANISYFCRECRKVYAKEYRRLPHVKAIFKAGTKKWRDANPEKQREIQRLDARKYRLSLRQRVLKAYGGDRPSCKCCGESIVDFLAVDHIDGNGAAHRRELGGTGTVFYAWLVKNNFPNGFRLLCHNCNFARSRNGGVCPHEIMRARVAS